MHSSGSGFPASADGHGAVAGQSWCARPGSPPAPTRAPGGDCSHPSPALLTAGPLHWAAGGTPTPRARCFAPTRFRVRPLPMVRAPCPLAADEQSDPPMMATHWSADDPTHLGGYQKLTRMCAATSRPPRPARGPTRDPRTPPFRLRYVHSPAAGDSAAEASTKADEAATARSPPAGDRAVDDVLAAKRARQVPSRPGSRLAMPHCQFHST